MPTPQRPCTVKGKACQSPAAQQPTHPQPPEPYSPGLHSAGRPLPSESSHSQQPELCPVPRFPHRTNPAPPSGPEALSDPHEARRTRSGPACIYTVLVVCLPACLFPSGPKHPQGRDWAFHVRNQVWQSPAPGLDGWLNSTEGRTGPAATIFVPTLDCSHCPRDSVRSSIPGCVTFVPSMLGPGRTGGQSPLDMHRVCGLISGKGKGAEGRWP